MKFKVKEKPKKKYRVDMIEVVGSPSVPIYSIYDESGKQILSSGTLYFITSFADRLTASGYDVSYSEAVLKRIKGVLPFA